MVSMNIEPVLNAARSTKANQVLSVMNGLNAQELLIIAKLEMIVSVLQAVNDNIQRETKHDQRESKRVYERRLAEQQQLRAIEIAKSEAIRV